MICVWKFYYLFSMTLFLSHSIYQLLIISKYYVIVIRAIRSPVLYKQWISLNRSALAMSDNQHTEIYQPTTLIEFQPNVTTNPDQDAELESVGWAIVTYIQIVLTVIGMLANIITLITWICHGKGFPRISRILLQHQAIIDVTVCLRFNGFIHKHSASLLLDEWE